MYTEDAERLRCREGVVRWIAEFPLYLDQVGACCARKWRNHIGVAPDLTGLSARTF
jgi:hypothetical protein